MFDVIHLQDYDTTSIPSNPFAQGGGSDRGIFKSFFHYAGMAVSWLASLPALIYNKLASIIARNFAAQDIVSAAEGISSPSLENRKISVLNAPEMPKEFINIGSHEAVNGFIVAHENLPQEEQGALFTGIVNTNFDVIKSALLSAASIEMFEASIALLRKLPSEQADQLLSSLLNMKAADNQTPLHRAVLYEKVDAIRAFDALLDRLSPNKLTQLLPQLLLSKADEGCTPLHFAALLDHADAIAVFSTWLDKLPAEQLAGLLPQLLMERDADGATPMHNAAKTNKVGAVKALSKWHRKLPEDQRDQMWSRMLKAGDNNGVTPYVIAVMNDNPDVLRVFNFT